MFIVSRIRFDVFEDAAFLALIAAIAILIYVLINPKIIPGKEDFKRWMESVEKRIGQDAGSCYALKLKC